MKISNILWLTDFSEDSTYALAYARQFTEVFGAKLWLLHVLENPTSSVYGRVEGDYIAMEANARKQSREWLAGYMQNELRGVTNVEALVQEGEVLPTVMQTVKDRQIDTVVMGTHGRTGFAHLLLGSVAEKVIRSIECPVYVVRHPIRVAPDVGSSS